MWRNMGMPMPVTASGMVQVERGMVEGGMMDSGQSQVMEALMQQPQIHPKDVEALRLLGTSLNGVSPELEINGATLHPMAAYLLLRGMKTLHLRVERVVHQAIAGAARDAGPGCAHPWRSRMRWRLVQHVGWRAGPGAASSSPLGPTGLTV